MQVCKSKFMNVIALAIALTPLQALRAQDDCGGHCKINSNLGMVVSVPVSQTAQVVGIGWGIVAGAGYNFDLRQAIVGEFMWNRDSANSLQPLQAALQSNLSGYSDLFSLTGNYRFERHGRLFGTYLIGGGGWYFRNTYLSKAVTAGPGTVCTLPWLWSGFTCVSGTVPAGQTHAGASTNSFGVNVGGGFTIRVSEAPYRFYSEGRYHYAPTGNVNTQFVAVTVGIRY
jgi:hypothetical protein